MNFIFQIYMNHFTNQQLHLIHKKDLTLENLLLSGTLMFKKNITSKYVI